MFFIETAFGFFEKSDGNFISLPAEPDPFLRIFGSFFSSKFILTLTKIIFFYRIFYILSFSLFDELALFVF